MEFSNENILSNDLPTIENVIFYPLEKSYLKAQRISLILGVLLIIVVGFIIFYVVKKWQTPIIIYPLISLLIISAVLNWIGDGISFRYSGYALRSKDILFRHGWLIRKSRVVPINRVQHVSVQSGPIERKLGLASVSIFTAGSGSADFTIKGVTQEKAQQIKDWISHQLNGATE